MRGRCSTRFWVILLAVLLALSGGAAILLYSRTAPGTTANVYLNGECVRSIDLAGLTEGYTFDVTGESGITDTVEVAPGRIRVKAADCPDQVCVHQGWIGTSAAPIVCLPNKLVIQIEDGPGDGPDVDAVVK